MAKVLWRMWRHAPKWYLLFLYRNHDETVVYICARKSNQHSSFSQIWNAKLPHRTTCGKYLLLQDTQPAGLFC